MRPHQIKSFNLGREAVLSDIKKCIPIKSSALIDLLNDTLSAHGTTAEVTTHRDAATLEITGGTTVTVQTKDVLAHELAGRISALVDFSNAVVAKGASIKL